MARLLDRPKGIQSDVSGTPHQRWYLGLLCLVQQRRPDDAGFDGVLFEIYFMAEDGTS
jgi:hypothetical protein